jgi:hypothetical protein
MELAGGPLELGDDEATSEQLAAFAQQRTETATGEAELVKGYVRRYLDEGVEIPRSLVRQITDVEEDAGHFGHQLRYATSTQRTIPCMVIGDSAIPVEILSQDQASKYRGEMLAWEVYDVGVERARLRAQASDIAIFEANSTDAKEYFLGQVQKFLIARFKSVPLASRASPVQFPFRVCTRKKNLTVLICGANLIRARARVFGSPTPEVLGLITGGHWVFGLKGPGQDEIWEGSVFVYDDVTEANLTIP